MFEGEDYESQESSSNFEHAGNTLVSSTTAQTSRKRKLTDIERENDIGKAFIIKSHPSFPSSPAQKLIPRLQLSRSCLPLAYLDLLGGRDDLPRSNLFSAHIEVLEENVHGTRPASQPSVLVAQSAIDNGLFAIERVQEGIYAMCRLGNWVTLNKLERLQAMSTDIAYSPKTQYLEQPRLGGDKWWSTAATDCKSQDRSDQSKDRGSKKARGVRLCLQMHQQKPTSPAQIIQEMPPSVSQGQVENSLEDTIKEAVQDVDEVIQRIRAQYQDALYASKSSLAYFAKGPLSRARAAFRINDGSASDYSQLTSSLRSCILSLATMDIKYRETLPELVKGFPFDSLSDEECTTVIDSIKKKARKSKKPNFGTNGLYPGEEANIARWWLNRDFYSVACDSADAREEATKSAIFEQRARETQMQIVLALETLALESVAASHAVEKIPPINSVEGENDLENKKTKKKAKKPQDLSMLLDLLVDRLCIWQSMSVDGTKASNGEDRPTIQPVARSTAKAASIDHLRQFCVDVVLPFYGARLPELSTLICKKLGGLQKHSPRRPPLARSASSCAPLKPGTSLQKQQIRKPRRTLERVLTDERSGSRKPPPSLSRSATDPILPQLKREVGDTSLSSIPLSKVVMHKRYSQREVDLHATSQSAEAKVKKKARVAQELQDAIATLKKPNPRMAVKELVEDAEKRSTASHSRKPKNPVRNPFAEGAQVMATPSNNRHKDVYGGLPRLPWHSIAPLPEIEEIPPSSVSCVPSSSRKGQQPPFLAPDSIGKTSRSALPVDETPTRGPSKLWGRPPTSTIAMKSLLDAPQPSPLSAASTLPKTNDGLINSTHWPLHVRGTPSKFRFSYQVEQSGDTSIHAKLFKAPSVAETPPESSTSNVSLPVSQEKEESIYTALGWDDVDELM